MQYIVIRWSCPYQRVHYLLETVCRASWGFVTRIIGHIVMMFRNVFFTHVLRSNQFRWRSLKWLSNGSYSSKFKMAAKVIFHFVTATFPVPGISITIPTISVQFIKCFITIPPSAVKFSQLLIRHIWSVKFKAHRYLQPAWSTQIT